MSYQYQFKSLIFCTTIFFASSTSAEWVKLDCVNSKDNTSKNELLEIHINEKDNRVIWISIEAVNVDFKPYVITYTVPKSSRGLDFPQLHRINRQIGNLNISDAKTDIFIKQLQCTQVVYTDRKF
jgi:hypothetical protein